MPKSTRSHKASSCRGGRGSRDDWTVVDARAMPLGPGVSTASIEDVLAALQGFDPDDGWEAAADRVIPLFQRVRPYPGEFPPAVRIMVPPGVSVSFAIDHGPAVTHITQEFIERWQVPLPVVRDRAMHNLDARAVAATSIGLVRQPVGSVPLRTLQSGTGSASTFVLVPHRLAALFGPEPQFFIAPVRDILISLPAGVDRDFAAWIMREFAELDPNFLAPVGFAYRDGTVSVELLEEAMATA